MALPEPWPPNPWPTVFRTVRASEPGLTEQGLRFLTVHSPALRGRGDLVVFAPPPGSARDVPIVLLLHGVYGSAWNWALNGAAHRAAAELMNAGRIGPMVLVMPSDGMSGEGTAYLPTAGADYERWVAVDAVAAAVESVEAITSSSPLFVGGVSMGGFGAARVAASFRERVTGVAMHSPITHLDQLALFTEHDVGHGAGASEPERDALSYLGPSKRSEPVPLLIDCGRSDPLLPTVRSFHRTLEISGVPHRYVEYAGAHTWASWRERIRHSLAFFDGVANEGSEAR